MGFTAIWQHSEELIHLRVPTKDSTLCVSSLLGMIVQPSIFFAERKICLIGLKQMAGCMRNQIHCFSCGKSTKKIQCILSKTRSWNWQYAFPKASWTFWSTFCFRLVSGKWYWTLLSRIVHNLRAIQNYMLCNITTHVCNRGQDIISYIVLLTLCVCVRVRVRVLGHICFYT